MFRVHSDGQQQLSRGAEVHVADAFAVRTAEDGQRLLAHGVPHVDRGGRSCAETSECLSPLQPQAASARPQRDKLRQRHRGVGAADRHPENQTLFHRHAKALAPHLFNPSVRVRKARRHKSLRLVLEYFNYSLNKSNEFSLRRASNMQQKHHIDRSSRKIQQTNISPSEMSHFNHLMW